MEERSLINDLKFGLTKEIEVLPKIQNFWKDEVNIINTKIRFNNEYHKYDFESDGGSVWEVKSRRNKKTDYPTTIIPIHKSMEVEKPYYFVFNFIDVCSYILYDKEKFKNFKTKMVRVYRNGGNAFPVKHYEIPIELLTDMIPV